MKKTLVLVCVVLLAFGTVYGAEFAVGKNAMIISGSVGFAQYSGDYYENADGDAMTMISFAPGFDYFIMNNVFVGGTITYLSVSQGDASSSAFGIGPEVGYAFGKPESKFFPYGKVGFAYMSETDDDGVNDLTVTVTDITIAVGGIFPIKEHIGIMPELSYHLQSFDPDTEGAESVDGNVIMLGVGVTGLIW